MAAKLTIRGSALPAGDGRVLASRARRVARALATDRGVDRGAGGAWAELLRLLDVESDELDRLRADVRGGLRDQRHYDELEERGRRIAARLRSAFRGHAA